MSIIVGGECSYPLQEPGLLFWYDGNDISGIGTQYADNSPITWMDKSGNGFTASSGNPPVLMNNIQSGKPGVLFTNSSAEYLDTAVLDLTADVTIFGSFLSTSTMTLSLFDIATIDLPEFNINTGAEQFGCGNYDGVGNRGFAWESCETGIAHVFCFRYDSANDAATLFIDDITFSPVSNNNSSAAGLIARRIGGHPVAGVWYDGYIFELLAYKGASSDDQVISTLRYLGNKWGVSAP